MIYGVWMFALYMFVVGMAAGWLAWQILGKDKALSTGRKPNWPLLMGIGVAGSFVAGTTISLLTGQGFDMRASGLIASSVGAIAVAAAYVWFAGRKA